MNCEEVEELIGAYALGALPVEMLADVGEHLVSCANHPDAADLKAVAGTGQGVGFGRRYQPKGRVRKANEKPENPDSYPIGFGMQKMGSMHNQPGIIAQLKQALQSQ